MNLPERIFFTGIPGSSWSRIASTLSFAVEAINTSDYSDNRTESNLPAHKGVYFGTNMEFPAELNQKNIDAPWASNLYGTRIIKSHEWAQKLDKIRELYPTDWIMMIHTPVIPTISSWISSGGFNIKYPNYSYYENSNKMIEISEKNTTAMEEFAHKNNLKWEKFNKNWIEEKFEVKMSNDPIGYYGSGKALVTLLK
jgi:hypothetical protein